MTDYCVYPQKYNIKHDFYSPTATEINCVYPQKYNIKHDNVDKTLNLRWV